MLAIVQPELRAVRVDRRVERVDFLQARILDPVPIMPHAADEELPGLKQDVVLARGDEVPAVELGPGEPRAGEVDALQIEPAPIGLARIGLFEQHIADELLAEINARDVLF